VQRFSLLSILLGLLLATSVLGLGSAAAGRGHHALPSHKEKSVCAAKGPETAACLAKVVTELDGVSPMATPTYQNGYTPSDLAAAYKWADPTGATWTGNGITIAIVDAYDNPNAYSDLAVYRSQFGLPPCTIASGCFQKVNQNGATSPLPAGNVGWGQEIALDIQMASAVCPQCSILLVEANSNSLADLGTAVNRAATMGADAISNSYGTTSEFNGETSYDSYYNHPGIAITASTGDSGYGTSFPAVSNHVVAVGGTSLVEDGSARGFSETAWSGAGSGCSTYFSKPSWQVDPNCARRAVADVSAVGNPSTGVAVYDTYGSSGGNNWYVFGGTSVSAPIIAGAYALASNGTTVDYPARLLYQNPAGLFDVVGGSNGNCGGTYLCNAVVGFDGPTGLGTPNGLASFTAAPPTPNFSLSVSPSSRTVIVGTTAGYTVTMTPSGGFSNTVDLSVASGLPAGATPTFSPSSTTGGTSSLSITTAGVAPGTYPFTISGTDDTLTRTVPATLVVAPVPVGDFTIAVSPSSKKINSSGNSNYTVSIGRINGFTGAVTLSASGLPSGLTASFTPNPVTGTSSTLRLTASNLPRRTAFTITITGQSGGLSHSATLSINVK
jgi:subtilase family serine protease